MELRQLEALYWIAKLGGFSAAALHLRTTQPAISGRIAALEGELGVQVFERSGNRCGGATRARKSLRSPSR